MAHYTILLIDYEPRSIERFRDPLVAAGYTVEIATDGISGIEAFHRLNPDMVLVEAMIPKKHGFEVCQELKRTPHGRRTPVLITTGVYKGRKYRTQALHIYGCDEYIEKPIAAEQLLETVGKFFQAGATPAPSAPAPSVPAAQPSASREQRDQHPVGTAAASTDPKEVGDSPANRTKPTTIPKSQIGDDTEDEIMARLDAILPDSGIPQLAEKTSIAMVADVDDFAGLPDELDEIETEPQAGPDPFAQMRAELDAELGSFSGALAVDIDPMKRASTAPVLSDQQTIPSVLEVLPEPEESRSIPLSTGAGSPAAEKPGQLVSFDTKRSRKNKKAGKGQKARLKGDAEIATAPMASATAPIELARSLPDASVKSRTIAEPKAPAATRRGIPAWIWAAAAVVAIGVSYVVISRGRGEPVTDALPAPPVHAPKAESTPVENPPPVETHPVPEPAPPAAAASVPVHDQAPVAAPPAEPLRAVTDIKKTAKLPVPKASSDSSAISKWQPKKAERVKAAPVVAPPAPEESVAGVEAVTDIAAPVVPEPSTPPGALVAIDEADVLPVTLQRKLPVLSLQAREMHLAGTVVMNVLVNEHGGVDQVVLVTGVPGADVNESAIRAAKSWAYRPATKQGVPVKVWKSEQIVFKP